MYDMLPYMNQIIEIFNYFISFGEEVVNAPHLLHASSDDSNKCASIEKAKEG